MISKPSGKLTNPAEGVLLTSALLLKHSHWYLMMEQVKPNHGASTPRGTQGLGLSKKSTTDLTAAFNSEYKKNKSIFTCTLQKKTQGPET